MNLDSLQEGLYVKPDTETLSTSNLPFVVRSERMFLFVMSTTLAKNKTYQPTLAQTKDILLLAETLDTKTEGQNWSIKLFAIVLRGTRHHAC